MVTGQELVSKTKKTFDNPLVEMKAEYESSVREITTLEEQQKKVLFHSQRVNATVEELLNAAKNLSSPTNLRVFKERYPIIVETKKKINDILSEIKTVIIPNLQKKMEALGKLIDEHGIKMANIDEFKKEVEGVYQKIEKANIFMEEANKFLTDIDSKIFPHKAKIRELGLEKRDF
jgi:hypothetical protein